MNEDLLSNLDPEMEIKIKTLESVMKLIKVHQILKLSVLDKIDISEKVRAETTEHYRAAINDFANSLHKLIADSIEDALSGLV